jgi:hypothetical protein
MSAVTVNGAKSVAAVSGEPNEGKFSGDGELVNGAG